MNCPRCGAIEAIDRGSCLICKYGAPTPGELRLRKEKRREREKRAACAHQFAATGRTGPYADRETQICGRCGVQQTVEAV